MSQTLVVAFRPLHSCLVNLPKRWVAALSEQKLTNGCMVFKLSWQNKTAFAAWGGGTATQTDDSQHRDRMGVLSGGSVLEIDAQMGEQLGLMEGIHVSVEYVDSVGICSGAEVSPATADDWEIVELNAGAVEERLLQQARVVAVGQPLVFWVNQSTSVNMVVTGLTPPSPGSCLLLDRDSEVVVAPMARRTTMRRHDEGENLGSKPANSTIYCLRAAAAAAAATTTTNQSDSCGAVWVGSQSEASKLDNSIVSVSSAVKEGGNRWNVKVCTADDIQPGILLAHPNDLKQAGIAVGELVRVQPTTKNVPSTPSSDIGPKEEEESEQQLAGLDDMLTSACLSVESALMSSGGTVLVCGRRGSGKTSVSKHLAQKKTRTGKLVFSKYVDCAAMALDPRLDRIREAFASIEREIMGSAPAVLVLDDIDTLAPAAAANEHSDSRRIAVVSDAITRIIAAGQTVIVATANGRGQIHERIVAAARVGSVLDIPTPDQAQRAAIVETIAQQNATEAALDGIAAMLESSEGYAAADLVALYTRAAHAAAVRAVTANEETVRIKRKDAEQALKGFRPLALRGVALQHSQTTWLDVGGLAEARQQLRETLELPARYAAIFARSPLRLRSGVLLYGYPGCGKTLLAAAAAHECGLSFISTKGPELLSKYIGSSEQSVRDLFQRAVAAAPCVLFFDEFDAIAPRRGHDNTGVTDRVVNQLLTEMDGAEGLSGVYVLAATSRPDLIDPALLRPGRLDKSLQCPMPDAADRADILKCHATKLNTGTDVNWEELAASTQKFTGADLQALVYNAFLEAVHAMPALESSTASGNTAATMAADFTLLDSGPNKLAPADRVPLAERLLRLLKRDGKSLSSDSASMVPEPPLVTMEHFKTALSATRPSLGDNDRLRFETIYDGFIADKKPAIDRPPKAPVEQHSTLA